jgi:hypothetical protein
MPQVIPFRRDSTEIAADICAAPPGERDDRVKVQRSTTTETGW